MSAKREWILQGNYGYGHGWEDLCAEESRIEANQRRKEYDENEGGRYRVVTRRKSGQYCIVPTATPKV